MKATLILLSLLTTALQSHCQNDVSKNCMTVSWKYKNERIHFEMAAPTKGWVTIGFNATQTMAGAYFIMGRVRNQKAEVVEHYTISSGNYKSITKLGGTAEVEDLTGSETDEQTTLQFSMPNTAKSKYSRNIAKGTEYIMTLAFSRDDDFQHHSMMRTSINVKL
tara:strand:+ start:4011 stop:4502 length:492 start_codon:yes stop_codon:yes gene_type:complete